MRILRVIASSDPRGGGPVEGIFRSARAMAGLGHFNELVCLDPPGSPWLAVQAQDMAVHALGRLTRRYSWSSRFVPWLRSNAHAYDAVVVHGIWNYGSVGTERALRRSATPYFVFAHGMLDPWFLTANPAKGAARRLYWRLFERRVLAGARSVLFTSPEELRQARSAYGDGFRARVVDYGAASPPAADNGQAMRARLPALGARPYLLFLGRIHPKKGCDLLIEAFAAAGELGDLQLVMAGPDEVGWSAALKATAERLGVADRVHWAGMLSGADKWSALHGAEAFVLPSHQENFGIAVVEAIACGKPVLISDKVNIWRDIEQAGAGLVDSDDRAGAQRLIEGFLALTTDERARMGRAGRHLFEARFTIEQAARDLAAALQEGS
jgi:glycosyltransferase involved in cell wall biosynthesis